MATLFMVMAHLMLPSRETGRSPSGWGKDGYKSRRRLALRRITAQAKRLMRLSGKQPQFDDLQHRFQLASHLYSAIAARAVAAAPLLARMLSWRCLRASAPSAPEVA